jgi:hypothetical protein
MVMKKSPHFRTHVKTLGLNDHARPSQPTVLTVGIAAAGAHETILMVFLIATSIGRGIIVNH